MEPAPMGRPPTNRETDGPPWRRVPTTAEANQPSLISGVVGKVSEKCPGMAPEWGRLREIELSAKRP